MLHQPSGGAQGQATDIEIHAREILHLRERLHAIYAQNTGQTVDVINGIMERDRFMSAEEAKNFGLVDEIVSQR
jgi:ATP-dependent Clp protease protease subunit